MVVPIHVHVRFYQEVEYIEGRSHPSGEGRHLCKVVYYPTVPRKDDVLRFQDPDGSERGQMNVEEVFWDEDGEIHVYVHMFDMTQPLNLSELDEEEQAWRMIGFEPAKGG